MHILKETVVEKGSSLRREVHGDLLAAVDRAAVGESRGWEGNSRSGHTRGTMSSPAGSDYRQQQAQWAAGQEQWGRKELSQGQEENLLRPRKCVSKCGKSPHHPWRQRRPFCEFQHVAGFLKWSLQMGGWVEAGGIYLIDFVISEIYETGASSEEQNRAHILPSSLCPGRWKNVYVINSSRKRVSGVQAGTGHTSIFFLDLNIFPVLDLQAVYRTLKNKPTK